MCGIPEMSNLQFEDSTDSEVNPVCLLELAANDDLHHFIQALERGGSGGADRNGTWYCRQFGSNRAVCEQRTPAMIAALYGSLDVLTFLLKHYYNNSNSTSNKEKTGLDINRSCGADGCTALHCATMGGSIRAVEAVRLLLDSGACADARDSWNRKPAEVIVVNRKLQQGKAILEELLLSSSAGRALDIAQFASLISKIPPSPLPVLSDEMLSSSASSSSSSCSSPPPIANSPPTGLPDIKNGIYMTDEFRMFSFKIRACSRAYSHDWTECPFAHPGENARRRDPRKHHYSCAPCPDFRKGAGACKRGEACEYAHGVFECWLHPAQYRTRLCKDGTACARKVCFFAHTAEELRPLYPSPRGVNLPLDTTSATLTVQTGFSTPPISPSFIQTNHPSPSPSPGPRTCPSPSPRPCPSPSPRSCPSPSPRPSLRNILQQTRGLNIVPTSPTAFLHPFPDSHSPSLTQEGGGGDKKSHNSRDLSLSLLSDWGSPTGKPEWAVNGDELSKFRKSASFSPNHRCTSDMPDLSWVQSPLQPSSAKGEKKKKEGGIIDYSALGAWVEQLHLDQIAA